MKKLLCIGAVAMAAAMGCNPSGTGGNPTNSKEQFRLTGPTLSTAIDQGATQTIKVTVANKGSDFKQDVKIKVEAPKGVSVEPSTIVVKASETEADFKVTAAKDAPTGKADLHFTGAPADGGASTPPLVVSLDVKEKK
jgi:uncharacterized membrane protein